MKIINIGKEYLKLNKSVQVIKIISDYLTQHKCENDSYWIGITQIKYVYKTQGGARAVMVNFLGNAHGDTSSNPGRD